MARGVAMDMGTAAVLDTGTAEIVLISRHVEPSDLNCLLSLGIAKCRRSRARARR
jgi:hypothetical protein